MKMAGIFIGKNVAFGFVGELQKGNRVVLVAMKMGKFLRVGALVECLNGFFNDVPVRQQGVVGVTVGEGKVLLDSSYHT